MSELFIPPFPPRPAQPLNPVRAMLRARKNLLSIWHEGAFEKYMMTTALPARRIVVVNALDAIRQIFIENPEVYEPKSPQMRQALTPLLGDGLFVSDGEVWRRRREWVTPALESAQLPQYAPLMARCAQETAERWASLPAGQTVDVLSDMAVLAAQIIGRTVFGDGVSEEEAERVVRGFSDYQAVVGQMDLIAMLGGPSWLASGKPNRRARRAAASAQAMVDKILARAGRSGDDMRLAVALLQSASEDEEDPAEALRNEALVLFMAGHETTANTLAWAWSLIAGRPDIEAMLHEEVDSVLSGRTPTMEDVRRLPFTRAIIEETLRLYPPVPLLSREAIGPDTLRDTKIDKGDLIIIAPWLIHRHKRYWDNPDAFLPERFMPGAKTKPLKFSYLPFSGGPRICLGARFGLVEAILCIATLAQQFRLTALPGKVPEVECRLTLRPRGGLPMRLERRQADRRVAS